MTPATKDL